MTTIDWYEHARLYSLMPSRRKQLMAGPLHTLVGLALEFQGGTDETVIETDGGAMFCRQEIHYIGMLASRPAPVMDCAADGAGRDERRTGRDAVSRVVRTSPDRPMHVARQTI